MGHKLLYLFELGRYSKLSWGKYISASVLSSFFLCQWSGLQADVLTAVWKELVDSAAHWRERIQPHNTSRPPGNWLLFSKLRIDATCSRIPEQKVGWNIIQNGDNCWAAHENRRKFLDNKVTKCFVPSYVLRLKQQLIDLKKEGYSAAFMDQLQPQIKKSEYTVHFDCGSEYQISVKLLDQKKNPISFFQPEKLNCLCSALFQMSHVFKDYGPGVRFIRFTCGGKERLVISKIINVENCSSIFGMQDVIKI
uniref:Zgc:153722 n=1 Tax=Cyprinus carpio TaxID=7962 RepID=A0A8C1TZK3_CYPCA